jgi:hypothetical protein
MFQNRKRLSFQEWVDGICKILTPYLDCSKLEDLKNKKEEALTSLFYTAPEMKITAEDTQKRYLFMHVVSLDLQCKAKEKLERFFYKYT